MPKLDLMRLKYETTRLGKVKEVPNEKGELVEV